MKRMKVFIIAVISILLIVTLGRFSMADEPTIEKKIEKGSVMITFNGLKYDYKNVLCVSKGVAVKHEQEHGDNDETEYVLIGSADIDGNEVTLTKYDWNDNYTSLSDEVITEKIVTQNGESNILAAILTTNIFTNGYSGGYFYDSNGNIIYEKDKEGNYILDEDGNPIPKEEAGRYGPRQLCAWGHWNTWAASLPTLATSTTGVDWQMLFTPENNNNDPSKWSKSESNLSYKCKCGYIYCNFTEKTNFPNLPNDWVCPKCGQAKTSFTKLTQAEQFETDINEIKAIASRYKYRVKLNFVQHVCEDGGLRQKTAQSLIVFETKDPEIEIVVEKKWKENETLINMRPEKISVLVETYQQEIASGDSVHINGEDKIVELTEDINWKSTLSLKAWPDQYGEEKQYKENSNKRYSVKEVFEINEGQDYQIKLKQFPGYTTEDIVLEDVKDEKGNVIRRKVKINDEVILELERETLVFPKVEIIDGILYVAGKHVVESASVDGIEVADIVTVNGYKLALDQDGKYIEPVTDEEIANRRDTKITNKLYAVVKEDKIVGNTSYILDDVKMITVPEDIGTGEYNNYIESHFNTDPEVNLTTYNAYIRFTNKLEAINIPVKKEWSQEIEDLTKKGVTVPESVTVQLLANGEIVEGRTITLTAANSWSGKFENLMKYDNYGNEIKYTIQEIEVPGFASEITGDVTTGYLITNTYYDGYYEIKGKVWLEKTPGKGNNTNGTLTEDDIGIPGIKATLYYNGEQFDNTSFASTDENGEYTIRVNYDDSSNVYKLHDNAATVKSKLSDGKAWIRFEYDGMLYTTVRCDGLTAQGITAENTSKALEEVEQRLYMDKQYYKVKTETPEIEYNKDSKGIPSIDYKNEEDGYWNETRIYADTLSSIKSFIDYPYTSTHNVNETIKYCEGDTNNNGLEEYICTNKKVAWGTVQTGEQECANCTGGHSIETHEIEVTTISGVNLGLFERERQDVTIDSSINKVEVSIEEQNHTYIYNEIAGKIEKDENGNIKGEGKTYATHITQGLPIYIRPLNPANVVLLNKAVNNNVSSEKLNEMLTVYVTYAFNVGNISDTVIMKVDSIINDYDSRYEINSVRVETLDNDKNVVDTNDKIVFGDSTVITDDTGLEHNRIILSGLDISADAQSASKQVILIRYKVNSDAIVALLQGDTVLNNAVEIDSYETYYGNGTLYANEDVANESNKLTTRFGKEYAGYDFDSHPGNADIKLVKEKDQQDNTDILKLIAGNLEDDTDIAEPFELTMDNPYTLAGTVWEDKDTGEETGYDNYRFGDGKLDSENENNLANVKVTLMEVLDDGTEQVAKLYCGLLGATEEGIDAITYTDQYGNYSFDTPIGAGAHAGQYSLPVGGTYKLEFTYGNEDSENATTVALGEDASSEDNDARNARNFKSTIISADNEELYKYFKDEVKNDKWHLYTSDNYSIAVDDIEERKNVDVDLVYENFNEGKSITAYSNPFVMTIEFVLGDESIVDSDGKGLKDSEDQLQNKSTIFDFGIIERAREDLVVSKTITYMDVLLANNTKLAYGFPSSNDPSDREQLNFVKAQELIEDKVSRSRYASLSKSSVRQAMIEMDSEITQGATVNLKYEIIVTNNSERDIDYEKDNANYYKFGILPDNPDDYIMDYSVDCLVTYVNKELNPQVDTTVWKKQLVETLRPNDGETEVKTLISQPTKSAIIEGDYFVFTTTGFNNVKPGDNLVLESIAGSKKLTYQEENAYDVHSEILVIDGKVARTIDSVDDNGKQIPKTYKSGNFVPSLDTRKVQEKDKNKETYGKVLERASGEYKLSQSVEEAGVHEQDDDSVKVTITQPTGITKYITTYVIAALIGLIVIAIGVVFIKKKVMTR